MVPPQSHDCPPIPPPKPSPCPTIHPLSYKIGALIDITNENDNNATLPDIQAAFEVALEDLSLIVPPNPNGEAVFSLVIANAAVNVLEIMRELYEQQGIRFFVGPQSDFQVAEIQQYANDNGLIVISPTSTANSLEQVDYIFRLAGDETVIGFYMGAYIGFLETNNANVYVVARNDSYGQDIYSAFNNYVVLKTSIIGSIFYDPDTFDAAQIAADINSQITAISPVERFVIVLLQKEEWAPLMIEMIQYPLLKSAKYIGTNLVGAPGVPVPAQIVEFVAEGGTFSHVAQIDDQNRGVTSRIAELLGGTPADTTSYYYDALYLLGLVWSDILTDKDPQLANSTLFEYGNAMFPLRLESDYLSLDMYGDNQLAFYNFESLKSSGLFVAV